MQGTVAVVVVRNARGNQQQNYTGLQAVSMYLDLKNNEESLKCLSDDVA